MNNTFDVDRLKPPVIKHKATGKGQLFRRYFDRRRQTLRAGIHRTSLWRIGVQSFFTLVSLWSGWRFAQFVKAAQLPGDAPLPPRPPSVEGYLPISGLMGLVDWFYHGSLNVIHPAATMLLLIFIAISLVLRKAFCGWICPVGFISDNLARLGRAILGRNFRIWKGADIALRSLKYLILAFFIWAIYAMPPMALRAFIESPYNKVADAKMLMFFVNIGMTGAVVIGLLILLSILVQGFWCRYLCPYGALMGLFSWASPVKVRRAPDICTDCGICDQVCPSRLPVMTKPQISSVECLGCGDCVVSCPVKGALMIGIPEQKFSFRRMTALILILFATGWGLAQLTGTWQSHLSDSEYRYHIERMDSDDYGHPGR
ncbi:MAG: 4Fe-4S binding protein [Calditrichaeota bacterium]|nr:4Fe-4S binding protein [Calditrichota bacterium]